MIAGLSIINNKINLSLSECYDNTLAAGENDFANLSRAMHWHCAHV